jgi:hypothetical protein
VLIAAALAAAGGCRSPASGKRSGGTSAPIPANSSSAPQNGASAERPRAIASSAWCAGKHKGWSASEPLPVERGSGYQGVVVPEAAAPWLLCQCSREAPGPGTAYWTPNTAHIAELERALPAYVRAQPQAAAIRLDKEVRQYLGIVRGTHRVVYVNLFPPIDATQSHGWRTDAVLVCDGGPEFFGVEYDIDTHRFTHIAFNSAA